MINLTSPSQVRTFLAEHDIRPNRILGQNFLVDRNILTAIVDAAEISHDDSVLEVGPGLGVVTELLLERAGRVTAVEKDPHLFEVLSARWQEQGALTLIHGDFLKQDLPGLLDDGFTRLVSNLPYSVGTRILMELSCAAKLLPLMVVTVQLEVGERIAAPPGSSNRGLVSVWMQFRYDVEVLRKVSRNCFWPRPDVSSAVVRLRHHASHHVAPAVEKRFRQVTKHAFNQRRKQLAGILHKAGTDWRLPLVEAKTLIEQICGSAEVRPADLSVAQWCELAERLTPAGNDRVRGRDGR